LNKPDDVITTADDPQGRPTVMTLVPTEPRVFAVGRLDRHTEGLLILTNDGDLAARLTHPRHGVVRVYEARVLGVPDAHDLDRLRRGIAIDGRPTGPADIEAAGGKSGHAILRVTIREGRNRQVRRMCDAIGHPVTQLRRVAIGPIRDAKLKAGAWRELTGEEVERLRKASARGTGAPQAQSQRTDRQSRPTVNQ
jgi:23S rRNA pseudouridine2605 synthase